MSFEEINALLKADEINKRESWEKVRMQCFYSIKPWADIKKATDLFKFPWEEKQKPIKSLTKEQVAKRVKQAKKWLDKKK